MPTELIKRNQWKANCQDSHRLTAKLQVRPFASDSHTPVTGQSTQNGPIRHLYLVVLEVPAALEGPVNQDNPGPREAPLHPFLGVLAPLYFLSCLVVQGLL